MCKPPEKLSLGLLEHNPNRPQVQKEPSLCVKTMICLLPPWAVTGRELYVLQVSYKPPAPLVIYDLGNGPNQSISEYLEPLVIFFPQLTDVIKSAILFSLHSSWVWLVSMGGHVTIPEVKSISQRTLSVTVTGYSGLALNQQSSQFSAQCCLLAYLGVCFQGSWKWLCSNNYTQCDCNKLCCSIAPRSYPITLFDSDNQPRRRGKQSHYFRLLGLSKHRTWILVPRSGTNFSKVCGERMHDSPSFHSLVVTASVQTHIQ